MTPVEKQEIVQAVLDTLKGNSTSIDELLESIRLNDDNYFELNTGKKVSFSTLRDVLSEKLATKSDLNNISFGLINMGEVDNIDDLKDYPKVDGWAFIVRNEKDDKGNSFIFRYTDFIGDWVNTKLIAFNGDVAFKDDLLSKANQIDLITVKEGLNFLSALNFSYGQDTDGQIIPTQNAIVSPFFDVSAQKTIKLSYQGDGYPFVTYYKYNKDYEPISRSSVLWYPVKKGYTNIEVESDAYYCRFTIVMSSYPNYVSPLPIESFPDISIERTLSENPSVPEVIQITENTINESFFTGGQDLTGEFQVAELPLSHRELYRVGEDKTINIEVSLQDYVFVTLYLYDKNKNPIQRYSVNDEYWIFLNPVISNIITINNADVYYIRATLVNSLVHRTATAVSAFKEGFKINISQAGKNINVDSYSLKSSFEKTLLIDKQMYVGKFISGDGNVEILNSTASSINRFETNGSKLNVLVLNSISYFWGRIFWYDVNEVQLAQTSWELLRHNEIKEYEKPSNAKYAIFNVLNSTSDISTSPQEVFPSEFNIKISENSPQNKIINKIAKTIIVAKEGGYYTSVNSAVQSANEGDTLLVYPGTYVETVRGYGKDVNLIGMNKEACIIQMNTADRDAPPAEFSSGYVANLTFLETGSEAIKDIYASNRGQCGYAIHVDSPLSTNKTLIIENCNLISYTDPGIGIGLQPDFTLRLIRCDIQSLLPYDEHPETQEIGALYCHESASDISNFNQHLEIIDCRIYSPGKYSIGLSGDHGEITDRRAGILSVNSHYWAKLTGNNSYYSHTTPVPPAISGQNIFLDPASSGNNLEVLNP